MIYDGSGGSLDNLESTVRRTTKALREHLDEFDSIAVTGASGLLVGAPAALRVKKPLVVVRKSREEAHSGGGGSIVNRQNMGRRVLFLDDFVASGETRDRVIDAVERNGRAKVVAQFEYDHNDWSTPLDETWA